MNFALPAYHRVKPKESKTRDKYLDLARELKKTMVLESDGDITKQKKKRICKIVDFAVPADHRINLKECEKKDKYLDLAREL